MSKKLLIDIIADKIADMILGELESSHHINEIISVKAFIENIDLDHIKCEISRILRDNLYTIN